MADRESDLYVGYLPLPRRHARLLRVLIPAALWAGAIISILVVQQMRDPGDAAWETGRVQSWGGAVRLVPYPVLEVVGDAGREMYLLVEIGKVGSDERMRGFEGQIVRIEGSLLRRDGRRIIEIDRSSGAAPVAPVVGGVGGPAPAAAPEVEIGRITLRGEIVDSKCFLGAMKPGDGKTHKACAELCVAGGIPPMLVSLAPDGRRQYHILVGPDGEPAHALVAGLLAEPVEVRGMEIQYGDLRLLRLEDRPTP
jgi:hypothetical protein